MDNPIRQVRQAAAMNQSDFARELGRSIQSLQGYERGRVPPPDVIDRLKALAKEHHRADLVPLLDHYAGGQPGKAPGRKGADRQRWHDLLDEVLDSSESDAVIAVEQSLAVFASYVRVQRPKYKEKKA